MNSTPKMGSRPADDVGGWAVRRRTAMMDFENGRLAEAECVLDAVAADLQHRREPHARQALAMTLADRATVRRYRNAWGAALEDLDVVISMAPELSLRVHSSIEFEARLARARLFCIEATPVHDLAAAEQELAELGAVAPETWTEQDVACEIARQRGDWDAVARLSPRISAQLEAQGATVASVFSAVRTAEALVQMGALDAADSVLSPALRFLELHGPPDRHARARLTYARIASARAQHDVAWDAALAGLALVDSLVRYFRSAEDRRRFVADQLRHYQTAFDVALAAGGQIGCTRGWTIAERSKSFYLCQLVANGDIALVDGVDPAQVQRLREFEEAIDARERVAAALSADASTRAMQIIRVLRMERDEVLATLTRAHPRWAALRAPPPFSIERLLAKLCGRYDVLSLFMRAPAANGDAELHLFWAGAAGEPNHCVERLSKDEQCALEACRAPLDGDGQGNVHPDPMGPSLAARLWPAGLLGQISTERSLLLSAHGVFAGLGLHVERMPDATRPIELCAVVTVPTLVSHTFFPADWSLAEPPQLD